MLHDILHYTPRPVFLDGLSVIGGGEGGRHDKSDTAGTKIIIKQSSTFVLCVNMSPSTLFEEVPLNLVLYYLICKVGCFFRPPHHGPIDIAIMPQIDP